MKTLPARLVRTLLVAAIPVSSLCLFAVVTLYAGNATEFVSSLPDALGIVLPYALLSIALAGLPALFLTREGHARYLALLCSLAVLLWLQGNILVWHYGVLDGSDIDWLAGAWRGALDTAIWLAGLWLAIYRYRQLGKTLLAGAIVTFLIQLASAAATIAGSPEILQSRSAALNTEGRAAVMRFSTAQNIVQIVMDGFQSDIFGAIVADTSERDFTADLRGFTWYRNNLGAYPYTQLTVPAMLSGRLFYNDEPVESFIDRTMRGDTITNAAFAAGYEVDIAAPVALKNVYAKGNYSNAHGISSSGHVDTTDYAISDTAKLMDLALFRLVPHFAKALVHRDQLWVFQAYVQPDAYLQMQYFSDLAFLEGLSKNMVVDRDAPVYKLIHVMLSHRPIVGNERCEFGGRKAPVREAVQTHAQCGLLRVLDVLQRMKDLGIYDDSLIVLMADHGAWVPVEGFSTNADVDALMVAMATPVLAVKSPGARHAFRVSDAPASIIDVPATIADGAGIDGEFGGQAVLSLSPDAARDRAHLVYGYGRNRAAEGYLFPMQEYTVRGNPYDASAWTRGPRHLPRGQ